MSVTFRETRSSGGMVGAGLMDAAGGVATVVLAICGLTGIHPPILASVAVVVLGAELIARGAMIASALSTASTMDIETIGDSSGGVAALFLAGLGGVTLGVLALLGVAQTVLTAVAAIGFGVALILGSGGTAMRSESISASESSPVTGGAPVIAGLASILLGILALVQMGKSGASLSLILVTLLVLGAAVVISGGGMNLMMQSMTRRE